ncbi:MAG: hypothetical protein KC621_13590 [Myxococcales bacterium]|nr:hypothetical protein [Myxococcales bacterium]
MTDRIRTMTDDALKLHSEAFAFGMRQQELAQQQVRTAFEIGKASLEATRDLQASMARNMVDAFAPAKDAAKA